MVDPVSGTEVLCLACGGGSLMIDCSVEGLIYGLIDGLIDEEAIAGTRHG